MTEKERKIIKKIVKHSNNEEVKNILEQIRENMICSNKSFKEALEQCAHFDDDIISKQDNRYPLFEKLGELLDGKETRNIGIKSLCSIICYLEVK